MHTSFVVCSLTLDTHIYPVLEFDRQRSIIWHYMDMQGLLLNELLAFQEPLKRKKQNVHCFILDRESYMRVCTVGCERSRILSRNRAFVFSWYSAIEP